MTLDDIAAEEDYLGQLLDAELRRDTISNRRVLAVLTQVRAVP